MLSILHISSPAFVPHLSISAADLLIVATQWCAVDGNFNYATLQKKAVETSEDPIKNRLAP